jgi:recombination protein RecR
MADSDRVERDGDPLARLIEALTGLPGIGPKTAERLAFHLLMVTPEEAMRLAYAIRDVKEKVRRCAVCFNVGPTDPCAICRDPKRDRATLCVVELPNDLWAIERTAQYRGLYHVLLGRLAPLDGIGPDRLTVQKLLDRCRGGEVREVILATNPTAEGDATAVYLQRQIQPLGVRLTRLARGLPSGSTLEYANRAVVTDALQGRRDF